VDGKFKAWIVFGVCEIVMKFEELWCLSMKLMMREDLPWPKSSWRLKKQGEEEHQCNFSDFYLKN